MSNQCNQCGSYAINHHHHGRDGSDPDLCDVCYWHTRNDQLQAELAEVKAELSLALKVPSIAAMHTWLDSECAKKNKQLEEELAALKASLKKQLDQCTECAEVYAELAALKDQEPVAVVIQNAPYEDGAINPCKSLLWRGRNAENDLAVGTKLYAAPAQPKNDAVIELLSQVADPHKWAISMCDTAADLLTLLGGEA